MTQRLRSWWLAFALSLAACGAAVSCSSADDSNPDTDPIAWVAPSRDAVIAVGDVVELVVKVNDPSAPVVRFSVDGTAAGTCDTSAGPNECRREDLFRTTTTFRSAGPHTLVATAAASGGELTTTLAVQVRASTDAGEADAGDGGVPPVDRGFLDPDRPLHNVFDGVSWSVGGQKVEVIEPPAGSMATVAACMKTYGASIVKWADAHKISRASVVATAITESNCTNPTGSSDGLSSGPMQVTGSTCASIVKGYTSASCKAKMHADPDFSFEIGALYMGSAYQLNQAAHDPPKTSAAYNAGSIRKSTANRWHMVVTGNHIERFVGAYNAYRAWEAMTGIAKQSLELDLAGEPSSRFEGEHVRTAAELPAVAPEGQVFFVGEWERRNGAFVRRRRGSWRDDGR